MCGIAGLWGPPADAETLRAQAVAMADALRHRGPDGEGAWCDADAGLALSHRRLAIVDLSAAGHQPMASASGRWVLSYNGEVYNHPALRRELEATGAAPAWRGHSDTETLLAAIEGWGVVEAMRRATGMFAIAAWDRQQRALWLARDRFGEKPLYYGWQGDTLLFGSELRALRAHPAFRAPVDRDALADLLRYNCIPAPRTIHAGIAKLPPASVLRVDAGRRGAPQAYWSIEQVARDGAAAPFHGDDASAIDELGRRLDQAIAGQQLADVPLGALLSGGIDSSLVCARMQASSTRPVRSFTIGFGERDYDEAAHARAVAAQLGCEHTELRLDGRDALALVPALPAIYDEPFADASQLPTRLVMALARQHVTVALSGDGGDELFGGYNRYRFAPGLQRRLGRLPGPVRGLAAAALAGVPAATINRMLGPASARFGLAQPGEKAHKLAERLQQAGDLDAFHLSLLSAWDGKPPVTQGQSHPPAAWERFAAIDPPVARMMARDAATYLPDDILAKVDRASMSVSLETRAPFLDHALAAFAWRLPMHMKIRDGQGKWILRQLLARHLPAALIDRPKMGFAVPLDAWLRGPLRDWAEALLSPARLQADGLLDAARIGEAWRRHQRGDAEFGHRLWSVLMFQAWRDAHGGIA